MRMKENFTFKSLCTCPIWQWCNRESVKQREILQVKNHMSLFFFISNINLSISISMPKKDTFYLFLRKWLWMEVMVLSKLFENTWVYLENCLPSFIQILFKVHILFIFISDFQIRKSTVFHITQLFDDKFPKFDLHTTVDWIVDAHAEFKNFWRRFCFSK